MSILNIIQVYNWSEKKRTQVRFFWNQAGCAAKKSMTCWKFWMAVVVPML